MKLCYIFFLWNTSPHHPYPLIAEPLTADESELSTTVPSTASQFATLTYYLSDNSFAHHLAFQKQFVQLPLLSVHQHRLDLVL